MILKWKSWETAKPKKTKYKVIVKQNLRFSVIKTKFKQQIKANENLTVKKIVA